MNLPTFGYPMTEIIIEYINIIPSILWILFALTVIIIFYKPICRDILPKISDFRAMGVEFSIVRDSFNATLDKAEAHDSDVKLAEKSPQWKVVVPPEAKENVLNRARNHLPVLRGAQILWVDDHPENNLNERKMFSKLNVEIDTAKNTDEALGILKHANYDLIFSDIARGENSTDGLAMLDEFKKNKITIPVIFYIGVIEPEKGVPAGAFGITNRPDELLHLTMDVLERKRF